MKIEASPWPLILAVFAASVALGQSTPTPIVSSLRVIEKSANYTATLADDMILMNANDDERTITLPLATSARTNLHNYRVKKVDDKRNAITPQVDPADEANGIGRDPFAVLEGNDVVTMRRDGERRHPALVGAPQNRAADGRRGDHGKTDRLRNRPPRNSSGGVANTGCRVTEILHGGIEQLSVNVSQSHYGHRVDASVDLLTERAACHLFPQAVVNHLKAALRIWHPQHARLNERIRDRSYAHKLCRVREIRPDRDFHSSGDVGWRIELRNCWPRTEVVTSSNDTQIRNRIMRISNAAAMAGVCLMDGELAPSSDSAERRRHRGEENRAGGFRDGLKRDGARGVANASCGRVTEILQGGIEQPSVNVSQSCDCDGVNSRGNFGAEIRTGENGLTVPRMTHVKIAPMIGKPEHIGLNEVARPEFDQRRAVRELRGDRHFHPGRMSAGCVS